ncbi:MAG: tetratricopeptide repeat protein [Pseudanabaena sp. CRU_2_10]|nr:tetratricopeptide repeat protein [Pseudanabaena sp. CRU_2_10]
MSTKLYRRFCYFIFLFTIAILFCLSTNTSVDRFITTPNQMSAIAQPLRSSPSQRSPQSAIEKGIQLYRIGKYNAAIALWQQALSPDLKAKDKAAIHNNLAQAYRQIGQLGAAIEQWQQAISIYRSDTNKNKNTALAAALIEQAQMYSDLGQHRNAIPLLQEAIAIVRRTQDRKLEAAGLGVLGTAYLGLGEYDAVQPGSDGIPNNALEAQSASLQIASQFNELPYASYYVVTALNNRGNTYLRRAERYQFQADAARLEGETKTNQRFTQLAEQDAIAAQRDYEESVQLSSNLGGITEAQTLLDLNHLLAQNIIEKAIAIGKQ